MEHIFAKILQKKNDGIFDEKILTKIKFKAVLIEIPCFYSNRSLLVRLGLVFRVRVRWTRTTGVADTFVRPCPRTRSGHGHHKK